MNKLNILLITDKNKVKNIQRLFKFERIFCPPDLQISDYKISFKLIQKFVFPLSQIQHPVSDYLDLLAKFGPINNHHSIPRCFCPSCQKIIQSNRKEIITSKKHIHNEFLIRGFFNQNCSANSRGNVHLNERSIADFLEEFQMNRVSLRTMSGNSDIRIGSVNTNTINFLSSLKNINELEIIKLGNLFCKKCLNHCQYEVHLFGGALKNHILTKNELRQLIKEENIKDLHKIVYSLKSILKYSCNF